MDSVSVPTHTVGGGCGGGMDEGYRKILHASARCAAVTPSRPVTMRSFVPEIGMNKNIPTHILVCRFLVGQWSCWLVYQEVKWTKRMSQCVCVCELMKCMVDSGCNIYFEYRFFKCAFVRMTSFLFSHGSENESREQHTLRCQLKLNV